MAESKASGDVRDSIKEHFTLALSLKDEVYYKAIIGFRVVMWNP